MNTDKVKYLGFRPGVGHLYEDVAGHRYIHNSKPAKPKQKIGFMDRETGHKIHMSKKQRKRTKEALAQMERLNGNP